MINHVHIQFIVLGHDSRKNWHREVQVVSCCLSDSIGFTWLSLWFSRSKVKVKENKHCLIITPEWIDRGPRGVLFLSDSTGCSFLGPRSQSLKGQTMLFGGINGVILWVNPEPAAPRSLFGFFCTKCLGLKKQQPKPNCWNAGSEGLRLVEGWNVGRCTASGLWAPCELSGYYCYSDGRHSNIELPLSPSQE